MIDSSTARSGRSKTASGMALVRPRRPLAFSARLVSYAPNIGHRIKFRLNAFAAEAYPQIFGKIDGASKALIESSHVTERATYAADLAEEEIRINPEEEEGVMIRGHAWRIECREIEPGLSNSNTLPA